MFAAKQYIALNLALSMVGSTAFAALPGSSAPSLSIAAPVPLIRAESVRAIYTHLLTKHWVPQTGLFLSFVGSADKKLSQQASTYDQGAAGLLALELGDTHRARGIFKFFQNTWQEGPRRTGARRGVRGFSNFYNAEFGGEGIEKTVHVGPNAWIGLFAARYGNRLKDSEALQLGLDIAYWVSNSIPHTNGGVAMGPIAGEDGTPWSLVFSAENNISYYALLTELLRAPRLTRGEREWITRERDGVGNWLISECFDKTAYVMNRGINPQGKDSVRSLDSATWLISALGPRFLEKHGVNPYRLVEAARKLFLVEIDGHLGVDATDLAEARVTQGQTERDIEHHPARPAGTNPRLIWYEGVGQFVNMLQVMREYAIQNGAQDRARDYQTLARRLTQSMDGATLNAYAPHSAYPYATPGKFFHDGWWTPAEGAEGPASSLIAGVWRCLSGIGIDPLYAAPFEYGASVSVSAPQVQLPVHESPDLLYGTSEDMTSFAWAALNRADYSLAERQAEATIAEWKSFALELQEKKRFLVGDLIAYGGLPTQEKEIFGYWALNDVAACHFILGKALHQQGRYSQAAQSFQQIALHYSLAQIWDPKGWFWSPMEAVTTDYVLRDPAKYGDVVPQRLAAEYSTTGKKPF